MIRLWTFFWLVDGEISGSQHHQPLGSNQSGVFVLVDSISLIFLKPGWHFCICKTVQRYCVYPLMGNQNLVPSQHYCFFWLLLPCLCLWNLPAMQETQVRSLGWEEPLEKKMASNSNILARRIRIDRREPGGLQSMRSQRVGHNWATNTFTFNPVSATPSFPN